MSETRVHNQRRTRAPLRSSRSHRYLLPGRAFFRSRSQAVLVPQSQVEPPIANLVSDDELPSMSVSPTGIAQLLHAPAASSSSSNQWSGGPTTVDPLPTATFRAPYVRDDVVKPPSTTATTPTRNPPAGVVQSRRGLGGHKNPRSFSERRLHVPPSWNPDRTTVMTSRKKAPPPGPDRLESPHSNDPNPARDPQAQDTTESTNSVSSGSSADYQHHNRIIHQQQHRESSTYAPRVSNSDPKAPLTIEVAPGQYVPLRGAVETTRAIQTDFFRVFECWCCGEHHDPIFVIQDANHAICPRCDAVTPIDHGSHDDSYGHGVGLGFTFETLKDVRRGVY